MSGEIIHGRAAEVLAEIIARPGYDPSEVVVITDPPWPGCEHIEIEGSDDAEGVWAPVAALMPRVASRLASPRARAARAPVPQVAAPRPRPRSMVRGARKADHRPVLRLRHRHGRGSEARDPLHRHRQRSAMGRGVEGEACTHRAPAAARLRTQGRAARCTGRDIMRSEGEQAIRMTYTTPATAGQLSPRPAIRRPGARLDDLGVRITFELTTETHALARAMKGAEMGESIDEAVLANLTPARAAQKRVAMHQRRARQGRGRHRANGAGPWSIERSNVVPSVP